MHLPQRDQRPRLAFGSSACGQQHGFAIALHAFALIVFGEAEVERASAIAGGRAAGARGESVDQPGNTFQIWAIAAAADRKFFAGQPPAV